MRKTSLKLHIIMNLSVSKQALSGAWCLFISAISAFNVMGSNLSIDYINTTQAISLSYVLMYV